MSRARAKSTIHKLLYRVTRHVERFQSCDTAGLNPLKRVIPLNSFGEEQALCYFVIYNEYHLRYVLENLCVTVMIEITYKQKADYF